MESFSADWLALREPADHAARAHDLTAEIAARLSRQARTRAIDLAGGTGSNVRYLLPRLPHIVHWTLVDHDPALLHLAERALQPLARAQGITVETRCLDLTDLDALPLDHCALVTASALLDLVSERWVRAFAARCRAAQVDVLCALSYDGRIACEPRDPDDDRVRAHVNAHQRTDKGFGLALGPGAVGVVAEAFAGWDVRVSTSDWLLDASHAELQRQLVEGWSGAAREVAPADADDIGSWRVRRLAHIAEGRSRIRVGHRDVAAFSEGSTGRPSPQ